ncbi:MAG: hypothetical protein LBL19_05080 [Spirochaetaceae bacterium]|jgi:hypothetical protein|nr:hypothetical protein [Spirochaetaceae bacterium]
MVRQKDFSNLRFLFLLILLLGVLFSVLAEVTRNIKEIDVLLYSGAGGNPVESDGTTLRISESLLLCSQPLTQNRAKFNKLFRQFYVLIVFALLFNVFNKVTFRKYQLHNYFPQEFLHILVFSLLLGGRAPPCSALKSYF